VQALPVLAIATPLNAPPAPEVPMKKLTPIVGSAAKVAGE